MRRRKSASAPRIARNIRLTLARCGSREHARGVQWFFKEEVRSHGWYTADLRRFAHKTSREIQATDGLEALLQVEIGRAHV